MIQHHPSLIPRLLCSTPDGMGMRPHNNFRGRKLLQIGEKYDFHRENFRGLLAFAAPRTPLPQISRRKLSRIATKPRNSCKFSPSKVSHYTAGLACSPSCTLTSEKCSSNFTKTLTTLLHTVRAIVNRISYSACG